MRAIALYPAYQITFCHRVSQLIGPLSNLRRFGMGHW
jgi:hypothetical protein